MAAVKAWQPPSQSAPLRTVSTLERKLCSSYCIKADGYKGIDDAVSRVTGRGKKARIVIPAGLQLPRPVVIRLPAPPRNSVVKAPTLEVELEEGSGAELWLVHPPQGGGWVHAKVDVAVKKGAAAALVVVPHTVALKVLRDDLGRLAIPTLPLRIATRHTSSLLTSAVRCLLPPRHVQGRRVVGAPPAATTNLALRLDEDALGHVCLMGIGDRPAQRDEVSAVLEDRATLKAVGLSLLGGRDSGGKAAHSLLSRVVHKGPGSSSEQIFRSVLRGSGAAYDCGARSDVGENGLDARATQSIRAITLPRNQKDRTGWPSVNLRPQMDLRPDRLEASHGAVAGELDPLQMHYLSARGIPRDAANRLLIRAEIEKSLQIFPPILRHTVEHRIRDLAE